jgi:non-heme chloroperoxidase
MTDAEPDARRAPRSITDHELARASGPTNPALTEIVEINGRAYALIIDGGWREVADTALAVIQRLT